MPEEENERTLHGLIKGKILYRVEEKERKIDPLPEKMANNEFIDPREIIKGKFSYNYDKKSAKKL
jgi:hypothetical protein